MNQRPVHRTTARAIACAVLVAIAAGCSIVPGEPPPVEHYTLPAPLVRASAPADDAVELRVRGVRSAGHLGSRIVWSSDGAERGFREYERWMEPPAEYLRRAAIAAIASRPDLVRTERPLARSLDLELHVFEEHRGTPRAGRVAVRMTLLAPDGRVLHEDTFAAEVATAGDGVDPLATALAEALDRVLVEVLDRVRSVAADASRV